ncbi:MAG: substrate-binding domain-containing protein [Phycisphaerae bacterium]|nr:substrate-binding domain-containing protein [Phycisphaerae bacterium]
MATEFVKAKAIIQLGYMPSESDVSSVGGFVMSAAVAPTPPATQPEFRGPQLLFLADRPSARAMDVHGDKWNVLQPTEHLLAGRATAIIVNSTSKLNLLTLDQVRAIFGGEVDDWATIGGTGLTPTPAARDLPRRVGGVAINKFGLFQKDPAAVIFANECLPASKFKKVTLKKDTAEVVAAVSMDPQAIAFVDLSAIPGIGNAPLTGDFAAAGQTVKALAIQLGIGEKAKIIPPTAENIKNAMYPFSQRMFLYVHPQASDTAKDFAKFMATCGGSEASPYADTVKAVMETYQKHGLIPLADAAIERAAKDAAAAAKAKEDAAKPKPKGK